MESSGSLVVRFCIHSPGLLKRLTTGLSLRPASRKNSYETPAMTGTKIMRLTMRSHTLSTRTTMKNRMLISITMIRKLVPQRLCCLELSRTWSTVSVMPCSMQLMHLCSAPWYIKVRRMSSIREITLIYAIKIAMRMRPSRIAMMVSEWMTCLQAFAMSSGSTMKMPMAMITENTMTTAIRTCSTFSPNTLSIHNSSLPGSESSSSSKKLAEKLKVRMPRIMESAKLKTPRTKGSPQNGTFSVMLT